MDKIMFQLYVIYRRTHTTLLPCTIIIINIISITIYQHRCFDSDNIKGGQRLCFHPCLSVCEQDASKSYGWIRMELGGQVGCATETNQFDFGGSGFFLNPN